MSGGLEHRFESKGHDDIDDLLELAIRFLLTVEKAYSRYCLADLDSQVSHIQVDIPVETAKGISSLMAELSSRLQ